MARPSCFAVGLPGVRVFGAGFGELSILSGWRGVWGRLVCVRLAHCVRGSVCGSPFVGGGIGSGWWIYRRAFNQNYNSRML